MQTNVSPKIGTTTRRDYRGRPVCAMCGHTPEVHGQHICGVMFCYCKSYCGSSLAASGSK